MNLNISPVSVNSVNKFNAPKQTSFGLAKFSEKGRALAQSCADVYEPLKDTNNYEHADFFKKKKLGSSPFAKYLKKSTKGSVDVPAISSLIVDCGTSSNAVANANFTRQLLSAKPVVSKLSDDAQKGIAGAVRKVFDKNWDNPELSKKETIALLEMAKPAIDDKTYITLSGLLDKSDAK